MRFSTIITRLGAGILVFSATLWSSSCSDVVADRCGSAGYSIVEAEALEYIPHYHMEAAHEFGFMMQLLPREQAAAPLSPVKKVPALHPVKSSKPVKVVKAKRKGCSIFSTL